MDKTTPQKQIIAVTFLRHKGDRTLPKWAFHIPQKWQEIYTLRCCPFLETETDYGIEIRMQTDKESYFFPAWREQTKKAMEQAKDKGAIIAVSSLSADLPKGILPLANGRKLALLFAGEGAGLALSRMGKEKEEGRYVIADGSLAPDLLDCLPPWINHLAIVTDRPAFYIHYREKFLAEQGLSLEICSSFGNAVFHESDAILSCTKKQKSIVYAVKDNAFFLDLTGNTALLSRFADNRETVVTADGFFFRQEKAEYPCMEAEAFAFCICPAFRSFFQGKGSAKEAKEALLALGFVPSGFSVKEHRRKIWKS